MNKPTTVWIEAQSRLLRFIKIVYLLAIGSLKLSDMYVTQITCLSFAPTLWEPLDFVWVIKISDNSDISGKEVSLWL